MELKGSLTSLVNQLVYKLEVRNLDNLDENIDYLTARPAGVRTPLSHKFFSGSSGGVINSILSKLLSSSAITTQ